MPKRVDHDDRRQRICEALWRIASARGLYDVGMRDVAAEAGMSLGQLQHYFTSKDEMLAVALRRLGDLAGDRIRGRLARLTEPPTPRVVLRESLTEMLPLNDGSRIGNLVQAAYFERAVHDERLRAIAKDGIPSLRALFADQLRRAIDGGQVAADRDPDAEAMILISLVDGLTSYVLLEVHTPETALALLDRYLSALFDSAADHPVPSGEPHKDQRARPAGR